MDGLGNDFVIIDNRSNNQSIFHNEQIVKICDRKFIGCDQLIIHKYHNSDTDAISRVSLILMAVPLELVEMELGVWLIFYQKKNGKIHILSYHRVWRT